MVPYRMVLCKKRTQKLEKLLYCFDFVPVVRDGRDFKWLWITGFTTTFESYIVDISFLPG